MGLSSHSCKIEDRGIEEAKRKQNHHQEPCKAFITAMLRLDVKHVKQDVKQAFRYAVTPCKACKALFGRKEKGRKNIKIL